MKSEYFELITETSNKFWKIEYDDTLVNNNNTEIEFTTTYGRRELKKKAISNTKKGTLNDIMKLIESKQKKGYKKVNNELNLSLTKQIIKKNKTTKKKSKKIKGNNSIKKKKSKKIKGNNNITKKQENHFKIFTFERYAATDECAMVKIFESDDDIKLDFYIDPLPLDFDEREKLSYTPEKIYTKKVKTFKNIKQIFYGEKDNMVNSLLLKIKNNNYAYISSFFYEFKTNEEITNFKSEDQDGWILSIAESQQNYYLLEGGSNDSYIEKKHFPDFNITSNKSKLSLLELFIECNGYKKKKYLKKMDM